MNKDAILAGISEELLSASLPIDPNSMATAAKRVAEHYAQAPSTTTIPVEEIAERFSEMWNLWLNGSQEPSKELKDVVSTAICVDESMSRLATDYFKLEAKLEEKQYMPRSHAIALIGCAPLIRTLVKEQHLGLDRIRTILNVPSATFDAINSVLGSIGIRSTFDPADIPRIHEADIADVAAMFGDTSPEEADSTFMNLLGFFSRCDALGSDIIELGIIGFEPYLFILYFELLTLETTDRFPGRAVYECSPRSTSVKSLWNSMYHPTQENPYLNNAKSVYSLDASWAETKLSKQTGNGSLMLAEAFDILAELPYTTRRRVAHVIRCYLILIANERQRRTPLAPASQITIERFIERVAKSNSLTRGVLDQRLVDFLTRIVHPETDWFARGLGSSVNETNAAGRKYGDEEYLDLNSRKAIRAYEAHGGSLRDEYVQAHINSLHDTVRYHQGAAKQRSEAYEMSVEVTYVAHDVSRLDKFHNGHLEDIEGVPFTFRFITFYDLVQEAGGIGVAQGHLQDYEELVHERISKLPDVYPLKARYREITEL